MVAWGSEKKIEIRTLAPPLEDDSAFFRTLFFLSYKKLKFLFAANKNNIDQNKTISCSPFIVIMVDQHQGVIP